MALDVKVERILPFPPERVARYAMDWRHDAEWTQGIREARLSKEAPDGGFGAGAEVTRTASFLGRRIDYVLRVERHDPPTELDMKSVAGPFPMHVTYRFEVEGTQGRTLASIHVRGDASRSYPMLEPMMRWMVRRNLRRDLRDLEARLRGEPAA